MTVYPLKIDKTQYAYRSHYGGVRKEKIDRIIIHHAAAPGWTMQQLLNFMTGGTRQVSSTFAIGNDGKLGLAVPETHRPWTTSGYHDEYAITVEVCNSKGSPNWEVSEAALRKLIELVAYTCSKYGFEPKYTGDTKGTIHYHGMYQATSCPGPYLISKMKYIESEAKKLIAGLDNKPAPSPSPEVPGGVLYRVQTGAFKDRTKADALEARLKKDGFDTYMVVADGLYKVQVGAYEVKANADAMAKKLKAKGYDTYITTKSGVSAGSSTTPLKSATEIAREIWNGVGNWGTGAERKKKLEAAGYDYNAVQREINRLYY